MVTRPVIEEVPNQEELVAAWQEAKKATQAAKKSMREAESHFINCEALERQAWQAVQESEWITARSRKTGEVLWIQRANVVDIS